MSATAAAPETGRRAAWGWGLTLLLAGAPVWALYGMNPWGFNQRLAMASVYQVGVALLLLWGLTRQLQPSALALALRRDSLLAPLGWLFLWGCASLLWAHNDYEGGRKLLMWATALLLAALVVAWPARQWQLRALLGAVFAAGAMLSAYGILQVAYGIDWPPTLSIGFRPQLLFLNRNQAAEYLLVSWPLGLALLARGGVPRWLALLGWGALGLYFFCIMVSGSLAAQLGVAGQLAFMLAVWWRVALRRLAATLAAARREWRLIAVVLLLLLGMVFVLLPEVLRLLLNIQLHIAAEVMEKWRVIHGSTSNAPFRLYVWLNTLPMIRDHALLGVGIGNWTVFYPAYQGAVWQDLLVYPELLLPKCPQRLFGGARGIRRGRSGAGGLVRRAPNARLVAVAHQRGGLADRRPSWHRRLCAGQFSADRARQLDSVPAVGRPVGAGAGTVGKACRRGGGHLGGAVALGGHLRRCARPALHQHFQLPPIPLRGAASARAGSACSQGFHCRRRRCAAPAGMDALAPTGGRLPSGGLAQGWTTRIAAPALRACPRVLPPQEPAVASRHDHARTSGAARARSGPPAVAWRANCGPVPAMSRKGGCCTSPACIRSSSRQRSSTVDSG